MLSLSNAFRAWFSPQKLNDVAAALFISSDEAHVADGVSILNELIIPCMHLIINNDISQDDLDAIEIMRNRWCSYLGQEDMDGSMPIACFPLQSPVSWLGPASELGKDFTDHLKHSLCHS